MIKNLKMITESFLLKRPILEMNSEDLVRSIELSLDSSVSRFANRLYSRCGNFGAFLYLNDIIYWIVLAIIGIAFVIFISLELGAIIFLYIDYTYCIPDGFKIKNFECFVQQFGVGFCLLVVIAGIITVIYLVSLCIRKCREDCILANQISPF